MVRSEGATLEEWRWMLSLYSPSCRCEGVTALLPMPVGLIEDAARGLQAEETSKRPRIRPRCVRIIRSTLWS